MMKNGLLFTDKFIISGSIKYDRALVEKIIRLGSDPATRNIVLDGFAGMGGVTNGFKKVAGWLVIACINHWDKAIQTHEKNHPDCLHMQEDFKTADLSILFYIVQTIRKNNPGVVFHGWFSLECTHFSGAKGGMSRDPDSRTLAEYVDRYVMALEMDYIWIENVKEFLTWGPLIPKVTVGKGKSKKTLQFNPDTDDAISFFGKYLSGEETEYPVCPLVVNKTRSISQWLIPENATKGKFFKKWVADISAFGYDADWQLMNCADYGVPQHRIRLIMQFTPKGVPSRYPLPTHNKLGTEGLLKWEPVRPCLDLQDEGTSVLSFVTKKGRLVPRITSPKTIDRLIKGIERHVLANGEFTWLYKHNSSHNNTDVNGGSSIETSSPTLTCYGGVKVAVAHLIDHYFGNGYVKPITEPGGVTGTKDGAAMHTVKFIDHQFSSGQQNKNLEEPSGALLTNPKQRVVSVGQFLMDTQYDKPSIELSSPCKTVTANRKFFYLVNFQWFNGTLRSIEKPSNTLIARQDKAPNYLVMLETGHLAIEVFDNDPPHYVRLKKYMAEKGIVSVNMRMLKEVEMLQIMTMSPDTKLTKSATANKKMIGNAVPSDLVKALATEFDRQRDFIKQTA